MHGSPQGQNKIDFKVNGREFSFKMTYDADNACDRDMLACFQTNGICEPEVVCAMERIVRVGDTVIDGGANIGFFSIYLAQLVGPSGKVIAIEPGQNNIWKLEENIRINGLKNVEIVRKPLWSSNEKVTLYMRQEGGRNSLWPDEAYRGNQQIEACTLADFQGARLIKLDIEGAEHRALIGGGFSCDFIICELNEQALGYCGSSQDKLRHYMNAEGNYCTFILHRDGNLPILVPPETKIVSAAQNTNIMFARLNFIPEVWREVRI